jgi:hypothetical protein
MTVDAAPGILTSGVWLQGVAERFSIHFNVQNWLAATPDQHLHLGIVVGDRYRWAQPIGIASKFPGHIVRIRTVPTWMRIPD